MSEDHPNVQRVLQGMQAFNVNDLDGVKAVFRPDMVYRVAGRSPIAGEYHGIEEYGALVRRVRDGSDNTMTLETDVVLADDQSVMLLARIKAQRAGRTLDGENMYLFRFDEDGQCYEGRTIPVDQNAFDEFWS